jgi:hypothetical protein
MGKFKLQRDRLQATHPGKRLAKQASMHRTSGAGGADQVFAAKLLVDNVIAAVAPDIPHGVLQHWRG